MQPIEENYGKKRSKLRAVAKYTGFGVIGVVIFVLGLGVGNGSLSLSQFGGDSNKAATASLDFSSVERLYDVLRDNYDGELNNQELLDGLKHGLAEATGDPYTVYLDAEEAEEFTRELNGTFSGIGAELGMNDEKNLIIVSPIEGYPAAREGLRPQDIIAAIDGESASGLSIAQAVSKIRGPKGTDVKLDIVRAGQALSFTITREDISIPSAKYEILEGNIGYLQITQFGDDTTDLAEEAAKEFKRRGVEGVILDLRGNPGGLLDQAVNVASLWVPRGQTVLQQKRGSIVTATEVSNGNDKLKGVPTVVLINEGSASASEIVAGALKDHKLATLIGAKTFGKGSVQTVHPLGGGAELKVTIARWYRPNGQNIDKKGVSPDRQVKMTNQDYDQDRDPQKDAALDFLR